jgi:hypothetical protein
MKHITWLVTLLAVLTLSLVACSKQKGVDTNPLQKSFASADTSLQSTVNKIIVSVQTEDYTAALADLKKLGENTKLTAEQKQAITDTVAQINKFAADALKKATEGAAKAADGASKAAGDASKTAGDAAKALTK